MAVSSSPRNPAKHHRLETQASRLHPLSPQKELSVLPPSLSPIDNLFPTGSFLQLFQEQPQPPREPLPRWRRWRVSGPLLGVIAGKLVVMAPWRLRLHSQAVPLSQDLYIIIARRGRHTEGKKKEPQPADSNLFADQGEQFTLSGAVHLSREQALQGPYMGWPQPYCFLTDSPHCPQPTGQPTPGLRSVCQCIPVIARGQ